MRGFRRPPVPFFWEEELKQSKTPDLEKIKNELLEITQSHCSFCDVKINMPYVEIIHFFPYNLFKELDKDWFNLYISCDLCKINKGNSFLKDLLRPDRDNYSFEKYFVCDFKTGKIYPKRTASELEKKQIETTINIFKLNRPDLLKDRLSEYKRFNQILYVIKSNSDLKGEDFDIKNYGDILDIDNYSYRYFLENAYLEITNSKKENQPASFEQTGKQFKQIKIKSIKIKNIKGFGDATIDFNTKNQTNLILGINGRGKTTLLQLLAVALQQLNGKILFKKWTNIVKKGCAEGAFSVQFENHDELEIQAKVTEDDDIVFVSGTEGHKKIKDDLLVLAYGSYRRAAEKYDKESDDYQCVSSLFGDNYLKNIKTPGVAVFLRKDNNFLYIQDLINKIFRSAETENQVLLDSYDDYNFYFVTPTNRKDKIPFDALAEGYKAVFVWLMDMIMRIVERGHTIYSTDNINGIVIIDEIDLHLHPAWQRSLMPTLNAMFPNIQFIITSHSPFVIQSLSVSDAIILVLAKNEIKTKKIKKDGKFNTYKIEEIIEKILGAEVGELTVNDWLTNKLDLLEKAVEANNKPEIRSLVKELKENLPKNSDFHDFIDILTAGLLK